MKLSEDQKTKAALYSMLCGIAPIPLTLFACLSLKPSLNINGAIKQLAWLCYVIPVFIALALVAACMANERRPSHVFLVIIGLLGVFVDLVIIAFIR